MFARSLLSLTASSLRGVRSFAVRGFSTSNSPWSGARDYTPSNKKYLQPWEIERKEYVELSQALHSVYSCKMLGEVLKDNLHLLTDYQLSFALFHLWNHDVEIDSHFYNSVAPIIKEYVKNFDRECNKSLAEIATFLGRLNVQDDALWTVIQDKLLKERLYRYIPFADLVDLVHGMASANRASSELLAITENILIKHRLRITPDIAAVASDIYARSNSASPLLLQVLANPHATEQELTGLSERQKLTISG